MPAILGEQTVGLNMIYCGKAEFGQISRSFSLNSGAIRLKRPKNLTQIGPFLATIFKPDRLLESILPGDIQMADAKTGRALGLGGIFFRSKDPARLGTWYAENLGLQIEAWGSTHGTSFAPKDMPPSGFTVWSAFAANTEYFGDSGQGHMINLVVDDLDAALDNVSAGGATVIEEREEHDFGRFGWFVDPDGNRVELWEPPEEA